MATVICTVADCKHRSKRKLKIWQYSNGKPCYGCTLKTVSISHVNDPDGQIEAVAGKQNTAICLHYESVDQFAL